GGASRVVSSVGVGVRPARSGGIHDQVCQPVGGRAGGRRYLGNSLRPHRRNGESHVRVQDQRGAGGGVGNRRSRGCCGADLPIAGGRPAQGEGGTVHCKDEPTTKGG